MQKREPQPALALREQPRLDSHVRSLLASLVLLSCAPKAPTAIPKTEERPLLAVTIDDLPWVGGLSPADSESAATKRMLDALTSRRVPATGLATCSRITDEATLR